MTVSHNFSEEINMFWWYGIKILKWDDNEIVSSFYFCSSCIRSDVQVWAYVPEKYVPCFSNGSRCCPICEDKLLSEWKQNVCNLWWNISYLKWLDWITSTGTNVDIENLLFSSYSYTMTYVIMSFLIYNVVHKIKVIDNIVL